MYNKRGQVTIFVIIAILIVAAIVIVFVVQPGGISFVPQAEVNPIASLRGCIEPDVQAAINLLSAQGGYENPEGSVMYQGNEIKYLCYTSDNFEPCTVQQPFIKQHFENEMSEILGPKIMQCATNLQLEYEERDFQVVRRESEANIEIEPDTIVVQFLTPMTITKGDDVREFSGFDVLIESKMHQLLTLARTLTQFEALYGESNTDAFIQYYPDLIMRKNKLDDGTTIYILENAVSGESFTFASRSLVWPPGYGI